MTPNLQLIRKSFAEARLLWLACATVLFAFTWVRVWITSTIDMGQFGRILRNVPDFVERLLPVPIDQLFSYPVRIALTYEEPLVFLAISVWAISRASDCVSGELSRGTMELLLAQPVSRLQVLVTPTCVTILGAALLAAVSWCGTYAGIQTCHVEVKPWQRSLPFLNLNLPFSTQGREPTFVPMSDLVDPHLFWSPLLNLFCFAFLLIAITTFFSAWDRYRWRTIGIVVGIFVIQQVFEVIAMSVKGYEVLGRFSFLSAYEPVVIVSHVARDKQLAWTWYLQQEANGPWELGPLSYDAILLGLGMVFLLGSAIVFRRRDLPAPL